MDFILENYIWLITIAVFLIMIVVGYFADKNEKKAKEPKLKNKVDELEDVKIDDKQIAEWEETPVKKEEDEIIEVKGVDDSFDSWDTNMNEDDQNNNVSLNNEWNDEYPVMPEEDLSEKQINEEPVPIIENNSEEINSIFSDNMGNNVEIEEPINIQDVEQIEEPILEQDELEMTLPNIETLNEEIKDVVSAEDVWKF